MTLMSRRFLAVMAVLVLAWYLGLTLLPPLVGTCFDGVCGGTPAEILISFVVPLVFFCVPVVLEMVWCRRSLLGAFAALGLTHIGWAAMRLALIFALPLLLFFPVFSLVFQVPVITRPGWEWLLLGAVVNNGLAEETMMRGFVFRHLREQAPFWPAAALSTVYFAAYHLPIIITGGPVVGVTAILLAIPIGFLTAYLYERGNNSLASPALVHVLNNGLVFVFTVSGDLQIVATSLYMLTGVLTATAIVLTAWFRGYQRSPAHNSCQGAGEGRVIPR